MSALAKLMVLWGHKVSGSDLIYSKNMEELLEWGAEIYVGESEEKIEIADLVVYTAAVKEDNFELTTARRLAKKIISRDYLLYEISLEYEKVIAVSGTHGKTTVTAMISQILLEANASFTAHIGAEKNNLIYKGKEIFLTEACEYNRSFLALRPSTAVILNVEMDHPDTYKNILEVNTAFQSFSSNILREGTLIVNADSEYYNVAKCTYKHMLTYAIEKTADITATNIINYGNGCYGFRIVKNGSPNLDIKLNVQGYHNVYNALAAFAVGVVENIDERTIIRALENFKGVSGRFEYLGEFYGASVYRDYAHHPTEIRATIQTALRLKPRGKIITLFQPHTISRTAALFNDFITAFCDSDLTFILKEYEARKETDGISAFTLYDAIKDRGDARYYKNQFELISGLRHVVEKGDILLILGAGDITSLGKLLIK